ncbi:hypothetical protein [Pedobacter cryotolerans]|uniref:Uncharacterized protein n=1 Tax=Pedobacter cryotolerans TaxID=2571270 RepID=A0A4U1C5X8_9SPHI|nr:hypothetical protein [Pedobacter cryotolerans]TKC01398.1 hypothetical protein FA045_09180 [Pedobacter cryotolerans]
MEGLDAYYKFEIQEIDNSENYKILPLFKRGNNMILNEIFASSEFLELTKIGPIADMNNYVAFEIKLKAKFHKYLIVSLQSFDSILPFGVVKYENVKDAILFRITNENIFEIYVSANNKGHVLNYLQLMINGSLNEYIEEISQPIDINN